MRDEEIWIRVMLLAGWAAGVNLWLQRHIGVGLEDPLELLGATGGATVFSMLLDHWLGTENKQRLQRFVEVKFRRILRRCLLANPVLILLYLSGFVLAATYSSVTIIPPKEGDALTVEVTAIGVEKPLASKSLLADGPSARLLLVTNPFGRDLRLSVQGFVSRVVTLYPLSGLSIDPKTDLRPLPTLLFRPSIDALASLKDNGRFKVFRLNATRCWLLGEIVDRETAAAFMVGTPRLIPPNYPPLWNLELQAEETPGKTLAETMLAWRRPLTVPLMGRSPEPGERVYAVVRTRAGKRKAEALVIVGQEPFQDIPLRAKQAKPPGCEETP